MPLYRHVVLFAAGLLVLARVGDAGAPRAATDVPQTDVPVLQSFEGLSAIVNLAQGAVRIVATVSPTSPDAVPAMDALYAMLAANPSKRLRVFVVLTPALETDTLVKSLVFAGERREKRILYLWDPQSLAASALRPALGLTPGGNPAYNVFMLYDTAARFSVTPPDSWWHVNPALDGPRFDADALGEHVAEMVRRVDGARE